MKPLGIRLRDGFLFFFPYLLNVVPDVEVKGESAHYFLLVQGWEDAGRTTCRVRFLNSDNQINGAAAMATISGLLRRTSSSGTLFNLILQ